MSRTLSSWNFLRRRVLIGIGEVIASTCFFAEKVYMKFKYSSMLIPSVILSFPKHVNSIDDIL